MEECLLIRYALKRKAPSQITDFMVTAFEMLVLPMSLIQIASRLGMIDVETLRK